MHYYVVSPEYEAYAGNDIDPPEYGCDVVEIEADNPSDAKAFALRTKEMQNWLMEARMNCINPFAGLTVEHIQCPHGVCRCCTPERIKEDLEQLCEECQKESDEWEKAQLV